MNLFVRLAHVFCIGTIFLSVNLNAGDLNSTATPTTSVQLSVKDQKIYDKSLNLINQFNGNGNQLEAAYNLLVDLAKRNPKSGYPYAALADLKYRLAGLGDGSYLDAYTLAQKAIELDPNIADAYVVVAKVMIEQQQFMAAKDAANKAIALAPNKPEAMFAMARTSEKWAQITLDELGPGSINDEPKHWYAESERWYRKAINTYKDNIRKSNIYYWLGNMLS